MLTEPVPQQKEKITSGLWHRGPWWRLGFLFLGFAAMAVSSILTANLLTKLASVPPLSSVEERRCETYAKKIGKEVFSVKQYDYKNIVSRQGGSDTNIYSTCTMTDGSSISTLYIEHTSLSKIMNFIYFIVINILPVIFAFLLILFFAIKKPSNKIAPA